MLARARNRHRLAQYLATLSHRGLNVIDRDDEARMLRRCQAPRNESLQHGRDTGCLLPLPVIDGA